MRTQARIWRHFDIWLLAATAILTIAGVAMIRSAIAGNLELAGSDQRQATFAALGLVVVMIAAAIDYRFWSSIAKGMYVFALLALALIYIQGSVLFGSARWFQVGTLLIQPSELSKIIVTIVLADYLARNKHQLHRPKVLVRSMLLVGAPVFLIVIQPDLSTAIVLGVIWFALVWAAGVPLRLLGRIAAVVAIVGLVLLPPLAGYFLNDFPQELDFTVFGVPIMRHYQMGRLATFFFPDPTAGYGSSYNVNQARISIGSGELFGKGYGHGSQVQLRFLKVRHTDFLFSAMAEELGFVGAVILVFLLMFIIFRALRTASLARDTFGALICFGIATLFLFQGAFNIGMNLNLIPVSGLPLPFFSYGGSSLLTSLLGVGLIESVVLRHKRIEL